MGKASKVFAWLSGMFFIAGIVSKKAGLPGVSVEMMLSTFFFIFFYLPLWLMESLKKNQNKIFYWIQFFTLIFFVIGFIFKFQHWPWGGLFSNLFFVFLLLFFIPSYILFLRKKNESTSSVHNILVSVIILGVFYFYQGGQVSKSILNTMDLSSVRTEQQLLKAKTKSSKLREAFENLKDKNKSEEYNKYKELVRLTDEMESYIRIVRANVISACENITKEEADSVKTEYIINKSNIDIPTKILIGKDENVHYIPGQMPLSAFELKDKLDSFKINSLNLFDLNERKTLADAITFDTEDVIDMENEENGKTPWAVYNFYRVPLAVVLNIFSSFEYELKNSEINLLTHLLNQASLKNKENLAAQLAELSAKYETQKKEQEIAMLKKDQELFDAKIQSKNEDLRNAKETIAYFAIAVAVFVVLIFFVIRSSIIRKRLNEDLALQKIKTEEANKELQQQNEEIAAQRDEIELQKHSIEENRKEIIDSINYAKRLQQAILPPLDHIQKHLPDSFILYKPKDIVAGDFYWFEEREEYLFIAAADCTGHGVPGAMVSVVCSNALNRALTEFNIRDTGLLLDKVRELVVATFEKSGEEVKDGMDISLLRIHKERCAIQWSGANNPLWIVRASGELTEIKPDKQPIGKYADESPFMVNNLQLAKGTALYLFTDGYADQFGGPKGKKFKYKQLEELTLGIQENSMPEQKEIFNARFEAWKSNQEQVDDVCVMGIRL